MAEHDSSQEWVERATRGDAQAVEELLARHAKGVEAFLRRRAGAALLAKESGVDLVQSVCREVLEKLRDGRFEFRGEAAFKQWLYQAALLKLRDRRGFHRAAKRDAGGSPGPATIDSDVPGAGPSPSQDAIARERAESIVAAIAKLPPEFRRVVEMARFEGKSHAEIAQELGISEVNSRQLLSRALARLTSLGKEPPKGG